MTFIVQNPPFWVIIDFGSKWLSPLALLWKGQLGRFELPLVSEMTRFGQAIYFRYSYYVVNEVNA